MGLTWPGCRNYLPCMFVSVVVIVSTEFGVKGSKVGVNALRLHTCEISKVLFWIGKVWSRECIWLSKRVGAPPRILSAHLIRASYPCTTKPWLNQADSIWWQGPLQSSNMRLKDTVVREILISNCTIQPLVTDKQVRIEPRNIATRGKPREFLLRWYQNQRDAQDEETDTHWSMQWVLVPAKSTTTFYAYVFWDLLVLNAKLF